MTDMVNILARYTAADEGDREVILRVMDDVVKAVTSEHGGAVLFVDPDGEGEMNVHLMGDMDLAPSMLRSAARVYNSVFGVPEDASVQ